jgi:hypothetical protein
MRRTSLGAGLAVLSLLTSSANAVEAPPDVRTVIVPQAQVWCGPSMNDGLYPTNVLRRGDRVQVESKLDSGWLAIRPPAGSFSWINNRHVKPVVPKYSNYVVIAENYVPVWIGSSLKRERPTKISLKLSQGAQVRVIGRAMTDEEGTWLPIEPPPSEVRYIRKELVSKPAAAPPRTPATSAKPVVPLRTPDGDTLWRDAEKAENAGRIADAVRLYKLAGDANSSVNPARSEEAYRRAHWYEQAQANARRPPAASVYTTAANPAYAGVFQPIGGAQPGAASGQLVSTPASSPAGVCYRGRLHPAYQNEVNRRYHLLDNRGSPILSVVAGPGVDLSSYADRNVELWGQTSWDMDRRNYLLTVSHVQEMP